MGQKKTLLVLAVAVFMFCFSSLAFAADSISDYSVPSNVPLNQAVTAPGVFVDDNNNHADKICSFYLLDSSGNLVDRASDQYTDATGRFAMQKFYLREPDFVRGKEYQLKTVCDGAETDANFSISQKQELAPGIYPQGVALDLKFWQNPDNSLTAFFLLIIILCVFGAVMLLKP